jgi:hypothetical protein
MYTYDIKFKKRVTLTEVKSLYNSLKKCNQFLLKNGNYKVADLSNLSLLSLVSFNDGFDIHIETDNKKSFNDIKTSLKYLCRA